MIDYINANIEKVAAHHVGNKTNGDRLLLSKSNIDITDIRLREMLFRFFLSPFSEPEMFSFTFTGGKISLNPLYNFATDIFETRKTFHKDSITIATHLFDIATHPQIKSGDLFVVYFSAIDLDGHVTDAIGVFKSENRQPFLKLDMDQFSLSYDDGINIEKLDKGCLIFNIDKKNGYRVCVVDKSNKNVEAQYWKDDFLKIIALTDDYHSTKQFLSIAKDFVTTQLLEEFEITRPEQIDLLNRSIDYFKTREEFDKKEFEKEVFYHPEIIKSFRKFDTHYRENNAIEVEDNFEISSIAVKRQARVFKSVLKLDKNFHIYIHGDKDLIEKGVDKDGRKYYKIYYENES